MSRALLALTLAALALAACGDGGPTGPRTKDLVIAVHGGDDQIGGPAAPLERPLQVVVRDGATQAPAKGVTVSWRVLEGDGASVSPTSSVTDSAGVAVTRLTLGSALGTYRVEATFSGNLTPPARFTARAVTAATIASISPATATAGDTITLTGENFSPAAKDDVVLFDGIHGVVASATDTRLRVVVPACLPTRTAKVVVRIGPLSSAPASLDVRASSTAPPPFAAGQVLTASDPAAWACTRLPAGASYLLVVQNAATVPDRPMPFRLLGLGAGAEATRGGPATQSATLAGSATRDAALDWELDLRRRERRLSRSLTAAPLRQPSVSAAMPPQLGDTRTFNVYSDDGGFTKVTAAIRAITAHAIIYEDQSAPANGLTAADYARFGQVFDDPIYATDTSVFGQPSDIDGNGKVMMLFTPVVNQLTPKGSTSFIAGFFYGCDLLSARDCSGTNRGEIFYALVPDPTGKYGLIQTKSRVLDTVPTILAHEFMHMIHFNQRVLQRDAADESLWLSEALAHEAEDTVGGVFLQRGDSASAIRFKGQNLVRAVQYLETIGTTSLLASESPGTLQERGAGWLFLRYLVGRFDGGILGRLTRTSASSTANVAQQTGTRWDVLVGDWAVALYGATELGTPGVDPRYTFQSFDVRRVLGQPALGGEYPLVPRSLAFGDFGAGGTVPSGSAAYFLVRAPAGAPPLALGLAPPTGAEFAPETAPRLSILRLE